MSGSTSIILTKPAFVLLFSFALISAVRCKIYSTLDFHTAYVFFKERITTTAQLLFQLGICFPSRSNILSSLSYIVADVERVQVDKGGHFNPEKEKPHISVEQVDDWFVLLDFIPRQKLFGPSGTARSCFCFVF